MLGVVVSCAGCAAEIESDAAVRAWAKAPLGRVCFTVCNGLCAHRAMSRNREQPCKPCERPMTKEERGGFDG